MSKKKRLSSYEDIILELIENSPQKEMNVRQLAVVLNAEHPKEQKRLDKAINRLQNNKILHRQGDKVRLNNSPRSDSGLLEGRIHINNRGTGYVMVEGRDDDIMVSSRDLGMALPDDIVKVSVTGSNKRNGKTKGKLVEIVRRGKENYVGTLKKVGKNNYIIESDSKSANVNFFVQPDFIGKATDGDKVVFKLENWVHQKALPEAKITSVLGASGSNDANVLSILAENDLVADFPPEVEKQADRIPTVIPESEISRRNDIRDKTIFTIDPVDAKDFDDALSIEVLDNGNFYLGVHIADVTHYLRPGTVLDEEAYKRGTSVYLVDRVIPMLPEVLSNGVCSLRPNEDKLTYSCFMEIDKSGNLVDYSIEETVIHSKQRFTYEEAQEIIDGANHKLSKEVHTANTLAHALLDKRFREGAIDFDTPEPRFVLDEKGDPIKVIVKERIFAHRLIEECMLMANRTVAQHVENLRKKSGKKKSKDLFPFFYRVHDKPDTEKLAGIAEQVKPIGIDFNVEDHVSPKSINNLLKKVEGTSLEYIVNGLMLRAMAKAEYSPDNLGHFGLGFKHYAHFTSPIRRYPDVIVHRLLKGYAQGSAAYNHKSLKKDGEHCSIRERVAVDAERDSVKLKQVEYLTKHIGDSFEGTISGVTENGIFVNLKDIYCEGMVRVSDLSGDYYVYDQKSHSLVGRKSGKKYQLGDDIKVRVKSTNMQRRQIDFALSKD